MISGTLVIATHNAGKLKEIAALLAPYGLECISAGSLGLPEPDETGTTFTENALLKARAASLASGLPALADDSGLSVTALNGRPGVYTADWAEAAPFEGGPGRDWYMAMGKVEGKLAELGVNAEDAQAVGTEIVNDAGSQRLLGAHHRQAHLVLEGPGAQRWDVGDRQVLQPFVQGGAAIAWRHIDRLHLV